MELGVTKYDLKKVSLVLTIAVLALFSLFHLRLISNTFVVDENQNVHSTKEGYGDIPLHMTQMSKFAFSEKFDLTEPIYYGSELKYPFLFNFIRGLILRVTDSWQISVLWPVYILAVANIFLVFYLYRRFLKGNCLSILALILFFLGSGWSGAKGILLSSAYPAQNIDFIAPLPMSFVHQQTFFLGLFLFLIFFWLVLELRETNHKRYWISAGIVLGLLPLSHAHSFVAGVVLLSVFILIALSKKQKVLLRNLGFVAFIAALLSYPQLQYLMGRDFAITEDFSKIRVGWMMGNEAFGKVVFPPSAERTIISSSYANFLWLNFGLILPLFAGGIFLTFFLKRRRDDSPEHEYDLAKLYALAGLLIFLAVQLVKFQPWDFDNNKLLVYFQFFAAAVILYWVAEIFRNKKWLKMGTIIMIVAISTASGWLYVFPLVNANPKNLPPMFGRDAFMVADYVMKNVPEDKLVLTSGSHLNPVSSLAGRPVLLGYGGWLWTRGIEYSAREGEIGNFYRSPSRNAEILSEFPVGYILLDSVTRQKYQSETADFDKTFRRVLDAGEYVLYSIEG